MSVVLVTGIELFDGESLNPSWEVARRLDGEQVDGATLVARQLPCVIGRVNPALFQMLTALRSSLVLCLGQAGGRVDITLERVAINIVDARIPDNAGQQPVDEPIFPQRPAGYFSTLPIKAMVRALRRQGIPASVSQTAGTCNCNAIFYGLCHYIASRQPPCAADLSIYPICRRWRRRIPVRPVWRWRPNLTP
ncbi:Pyrrolidone-carboxylate peptidase [Sodalis glossinidius str. 'morsitans']|uniref:Pyroglutamyl-peptidase I n=1 Tax=Sodalis glossinidius (strain morsitans) TaxID=343509 RepID=Q2NRV2_SODGM|nr:putative pyrrolidone-carboxylate peptidase [Sodalis glossinidius str. 'morsitans']CRL46056.1 Pyrrolidone-carboxylate peptidase [Sodalis glossinidius str. 'morsitans']